MTTATGTTPQRPWVRRALALVAWLFVAGLLVQTYFAGLGVFVGPQWWVRHRDFVHAFEWLSPLAVVLAYVARSPRAVKMLAWLAIALLFLQYVTAGLRARSTSAAALHAVTAALLVYVSVELARRAGRG